MTLTFFSLACLSRQVVNNEFNKPSLSSMSSVLQMRLKGSSENSLNSLSFLITL